MNKKRLILIGLVLGIPILIFLGIGLMRGGSGNQMQRTPPIRVTYPTVEDNKPYQDHIFDTNYVHEVNIKISNKDWNDLTKYPLAKRKYVVDVVIDGVTFHNVSINTKGNSSLKNISEGPSEGPAANRFSFKIDFGKYEKGQTYYGLDKLNLNNVFGDSTYLNDYIAYNLFHEMGVPAPLVSFVYVKINGENFGLYSAVEEIDDSFLERNQLEGLLYKPEQARGKDHGASLSYVDEDEENYYDIFNNAESKITEEDKTRLMEALKHLNEKTDLEEALDTEEIIKYFAVHNYLLSYDSYTGKSIHNYYLLEYQGKLMMIPWDYNLSFGRYNMQEDINTIVNYGIDSPTNRAESRDRPMWNWIEKDDKYREEYHEQMDLLITNYFESGKYQKVIDDTYNLIRQYQSFDISAFYQPQQFLEGVETLKLFNQKRSESIRLQLDGVLSTRTNEQEKEKQIDAQEIDLNTMGLVADDTLKQNNNNSNNSNNSEREHRDKKSSNE